jgi:hypothetical protein
MIAAATTATGPRGERLPVLRVRRGDSGRRDRARAAEHCPAMPEPATPRLRLRRRAVDACALPAWYGWLGGGGAARCTIRSRVVPLPREFVAYLAQDGVVLPRAPGALRPRDPRSARPAARARGLDSDSEESGLEREEEAAGEAGAPCFPALEAAIEAALSELRDESAFVKLNWSAPQDAEWVQGSLRCWSPGDVFLLLKSSDLVNFDLDHAYDLCVDAEGGGVATHGQAALVLRSWSELNKACEFRCFVVQRRLLAVVQRYPQHYYAYLGPQHESGRRLLAAVTQLFATQRIAHDFGEHTFCCDVYVDRQHKAWLLDFGPLPEILPRPDLGIGADADAGVDGPAFDEEKSQRLLETPPHELLSWDELAILAADPPLEPRYVVVTSQGQSQGFGDVKRAHRVPLELVTGQLTQQVVEEINAQLASLSTRPP